MAPTTLNPIAKKRKRDAEAILPAVAAAAVCLGLCGGCTQFFAQGMNAEGVRLFEQARYQEAAQRFQEAVGTDPANADGYYNLAAALHRLGKIEGRPGELNEAEQFYNQCLDRNPNHRDCYRGLAVLLCEENRFDEAFRLLQGWNDRRPDLASAKVELARLMDELGNRKEAEGQLVKAVQIDPNNSQLWAALGGLHEESGETAQAVTDYQPSLALNQFQPELAGRVAALQCSLGPNAAVSPPTPLMAGAGSYESVPRR